MYFTGYAFIQWCLASSSCTQSAKGRPCILSVMQHHITLECHTRQHTCDI